MREGRGERGTRGDRERATDREGERGSWLLTPHRLKQSNGQAPT